MLTAIIDVNNEVIARVHVQNRGAPPFMSEHWDERIYRACIERENSEPTMLEVRSRRTHGWEALLVKVLEEARRGESVKS